MAKSTVGRDFSTFARGPCGAETKLQQGLVGFSERFCVGQCEQVGFAWAVTADVGAQQMCDEQRTAQMEGAMTEISSARAGASDSFLSNSALLLMAKVYNRILGCFDPISRIRDPIILDK